MSGLSGKRVVVTRAEHQATELARALTEHGAAPLLYPCLAILPPDDVAPLDEALRVLDRFDWLVLTSANTVEALAQRLRALGLSLPDGLRVAAVGAATAQASRDALGATVAALPERFSAAALAAVLPDMTGTRVLLPHSAAADDALTQVLSARGAQVSAVVAYRIGIGTGGVDLPRLLASRTVDAVTLASGSAVTNLLARLEREGGSPAWLAAAAIACIGESTAAAAHDAGLRVDVTASPHTVAGLCAALDRYYCTVANERLKP
jgi:uroporphyrinogen-III synthase